MSVLGRSGARVECGQREAVRSSVPGGIHEPLHGRHLQEGSKTASATGERLPDDGEHLMVMGGHQGRVDNIFESHESAVYAR